MSGGARTQNGNGEKERINRKEIFFVTNDNGNIVTLKVKKIQILILSRQDEWSGVTSVSCWERLVSSSETSI